MRAPAWTLAACGLTGCLMPSLEDTLDPGPEVEEGRIVAEGGLIELVVDATDYDEFVALDLDAIEWVETSDPSWDLAFRRFEVDLQEGLEGVVLDEVAFDDVTEVPVDGWLVDLPDADDDGVPEYVFADWYDYDFDSHTLSPADRTYVVVTTEGAHFKVAFDDYYDEAGTPARIAMRFGQLGEAP